jgi:hypothetical protein
MRSIWKKRSSLARLLESTPVEGIIVGVCATQALDWLSEARDLRVSERARGDGRGAWR